MHAKQKENAMKKTWILITDARHARCFERHAQDHSLTELTDFVHPQTNVALQASGGDLTGAAALPEHGG